MTDGAIVVNCFGRGGSGILWRMIGSSPDVAMTDDEWHVAVFGEWNLLRKVATTVFYRFGLGSIEPLRRHAFHSVIAMQDDDDLSSKPDARFCVLKLMDYNMVFGEMIRRSFTETRFVNLTRHPYGQCESLMRSGLELDAACRWYRDVAGMFVERFPDADVVRFEELVTAPRETGERLFESLAIRWPAEGIRFKVKPYGSQRTAEMSVEGRAVIRVRSDQLSEHVDASVLRGEFERLTRAQRSEIWGRTHDLAERLGYNERGSC